MLHPDLGSMCYQYTIYLYVRVLDLSLYRNWHCVGKYDMSILNVMVSDKVENQIHSFRVMLIQRYIYEYVPVTTCVIDSAGKMLKILTKNS